MSKVLSIFLLGIVVLLLVLAVRTLVTAIVAYVKKKKACKTSAPGMQEECARHAEDLQASSEQTQDKSIEEEEKH